jgi:enediyne biosynthesis protein E7
MTAQTYSDLSDFLGNPIGFISRKTLNRFEPVEINIGDQPTFLLAYAEGFREVLVDKAGSFRKGQEQEKLKSLMGTGLITANDERWSDSRNSLKRSFSASALQSNLMIGIAELNKEIARLVVRIDKPVNIHEFIGCTSMRMMVATLFGERLDDVEASTIYQSCIIARDYLSQVMWTQLRETTIAEAEYKAAVRDVEAIVDRLLANPKGIIVDLGTVQEKYGKQAVYDEVMTLLIAGFETTALTGSYMIYALACRPDLVEWLRPEADAIIDIASDTDPKLFRDAHRIRAHVDESLRLYPSAWWFARQANEDITVSGVDVSEGSSVLLCPWVLHRQPEYWVEPDNFEPSRFLIGSPQKFTFSPFGTGARSCIGQYLAVTELCAITALITGSLDLRPLSGSLKQVAPQGGITLGPPKGGLHVQLSVRAMKSALLNH